ncbi:MAG: TIGR02186 family protein, partial [Mesorhizobium sp.]
MVGLRAFLAVASLSLFAASSPGKAQTPVAENIQIGLSTD